MCVFSRCNLIKNFIKSVKWLHFLKIVNVLINKVGLPLNYVSTKSLEMPTVSSIVCMLLNRVLYILNRASHCTLLFFLKKKLS